MKIELMARLVVYQRLESVASGTADYHVLQRQLQDMAAQARNPGPLRLDTYLPWCKAQS